MIKQELRDKSGMASTLHQMGILATANRRYGRSSRLYRESLKIEKELGDKSGMAETLHRMGMMAEDTGDLVRLDGCTVRV